MTTRALPATTAEAAVVLASTFSGRRVRPLSAGAVADDIAVDRGFDGFRPADGTHNNRMTRAQMVLTFVSQASVDKALASLVESGGAHRVTTEDGPYARVATMRKGSAYYVSAEAHEQALAAYEHAQTAHLREQAERDATTALIEAHQSEWDAMVEDLVAAAAAGPSGDEAPE